MHAVKSKLSGLYAITDPHLLPGDALFEGVEAALKGGAKILQYRDKQASDSQRLENAQRLRALTRDFSALLIINDDPVLSKAVAADGVHLGKSDADLSAARELLGTDAIIGVTCHSDLDYAMHCCRQGATYAAFGRMFASRTKPDAPAADIGIISQAKTAGLTCAAIGGITASNASGLISQGADMLAVIHDLFSASDIEAQARKFTSLFQEK